MNDLKLPLLFGLGVAATFSLLVYGVGALSNSSSAEGSDEARRVCKEMGEKLRVETFFQQLPYTVRDVCLLRNETGYITVVTF